MQCAVTYISKRMIYTMGESWKVGKERRMTDLLLNSSDTNSSHWVRSAAVGGDGVAAAVGRLG